MSDLCEDNTNQNKDKEIADVTDSVSQLKIEEPSTTEDSADSGGYDSAKESLCDMEHLLSNEDWLRKGQHVFILSESGKPVYSR